MKHHFWKQTKDASYQRCYMCINCGVIKYNKTDQCIECPKIRKYNRLKNI